MSVASLFVFHGVNTPNAFYSQVENGRVQTGTEILTAIPAGHSQPTFRTVKSQVPTIEFGTHQLNTALAEMGIDGVSTSGGNLDLYERAVVNLGTRTAAATTAHKRHRASATLGYIASISAPHQGQAMAAMRFLPNYDGSNEPIVPAGSVALAGTPQAAFHFGAGPVEIAGSELGGVQQIDIDFGCVILQKGGETEIWNTFTAIQAIVPVIRIRTTNVAALATYGVKGTAISGDGVEIWLRKKASDGTNVANGTAEHIKFVVSTGLIVPEGIDCKEDGDELTLAIYPRGADADTACMTFDETAAIA